MSGSHHTVHSILPLRHLSSFTAAASFTEATGRRHRRVPTLSGGLERVKWCRDRVVCFYNSDDTLVRRFNGPSRASAGAFQPVCSGSPRETTSKAVVEIDGKLPKAEDSVPSYHIYIHTVADVHCRPQTWVLPSV